MKRCAKSLMIVSLNACRTSDCVDKVNGCTCDCDEDHEPMLQANGSACVARNVKISFSNEFRLKVCDAAQCWPNRPKSTTRVFDRGGVFVAARSVMVARAHT